MFRLKNCIALLYCIIAGFVPLCASGVYEPDDADISYISELRNGTYQDTVITGEISPVSSIEVNSYFANVIVRKETGRTSFLYIIKGLPEDAIKIRQTSSSFTLYERVLKYNRNIRATDMNWLKKISIELILPEDTQNTEVDIGSRYGALLLSSIVCKQITARSGAGGIEINTVDCDNFTASLGSGSCNFSNLTCKTGQFDTGSGDCMLQDCSVTEHCRFSTGSGKFHCSGKGFIKNIELSTGSGSVYFENHAEGFVKANSGSGALYLDLKNAALEYITTETGSGGIDLLHASCKVLAMSSGSGTVSVNNIHTDERTKISTGSGPIQFENAVLNNLHADLGTGGFSLFGILTGTSFFSTGTGPITLHMQTSSEDYGIRIEGKRNDNTIRINGTNLDKEFILGSGNSKHIISVRKGTGVFDIDFRDR